MSCPYAACSSVNPRIAIPITHQPCGGTHLVMMCSTPTLRNAHACCGASACALVLHTEAVAIRAHLQVGVSNMISSIPIAFRSSPKWSCDVVIRTLLHSLARLVMLCWLDPGSLCIRCRGGGSRHGGDVMRRRAEGRPQQIEGMDTPQGGMHRPMGVSPCDIKTE